MSMSPNKTNKITSLPLSANPFKLASLNPIILPFDLFFTISAHDTLLINPFFLIPFSTLSRDRPRLRYLLVNLRSRLQYPPQSAHMCSPLTDISNITCEIVYALY